MTFQSESGLGQAMRDMWHFLLFLQSSPLSLITRLWVGQTANPLTWSSDISIRMGSLFPSQTSPRAIWSSRFKASWAPGPNCPLFGGGQLGPGVRPSVHFQNGWHSKISNIMFLPFLSYDDYHIVIWWSSYHQFITKQKRPRTSCVTHAIFFRSARTSWNTFVRLFVRSPVRAKNLNHI